MKYKHIKGLQLQKPSYLSTPNSKIRELLAGKEVELEKENLEEFESLGVQVQPIKKEPKKKVKKEEK
jgi:hypothetical protein|tara:strand:+ start:333 stop:533 length:201 start_codon:yes stop_codon:yes gene_type:complete